MRDSPQRLREISHGDAGMDAVARCRSGAPFAPAASEVKAMARICGRTILSAAIVRNGRVTLTGIEWLERALIAARGGT
jgi:hypothetical protein